MEPLLTSNEMRGAEIRTINKVGIPALLLMEHAGIAVVKCLEKRFQSLLPKTKGLLFVGGGNNGGDAVVAARLLYFKGVKNFSLYLNRNRAKVSPLCKAQLSRAESLGISICSHLESYDFDSVDWIIDGLFGTGLARPLEGKDKTLIARINKEARTQWIVSIDLPSGLSSDTGVPQPIAVQASETVCLGFYKKGLVTGEAANYVGRLSLALIQIPRNALREAESFLYTTEDAKTLQRRGRASHKGRFGHVYVWGGEPEKEGASIITSLGALRTGVGLVTVLGNVAMRLRFPVECMIEPFSPKKFVSKSGSVTVIGPGMGMRDSAWETLKYFLSSAETLVLDADAITLVSEHEKEAVKLLSERQKAGKVTVLTPHPKEAARLLKENVTSIECDRYASIHRLTQKYPGFFVLKGRGTLIKGTETKRTVVVNQGDSGLSKGGTGDLLAGMIAGILAQGIEPMMALGFAVYCHGRVSELTTERHGTERSTLATELAENLKDVFCELGV